MVDVLMRHGDKILHNSYLSIVAAVSDWPKSLRFQSKTSWDWNPKLWSREEKVRRSNCEALSEDGKKAREFS